MTDPLIPPWEMRKICGGDHWTKDHGPNTEVGKILLEWVQEHLRGVHGSVDPTLPEQFASIEREAIEAERKRIIKELGKHVSRYASPIFAHLDSYGVGQVVQGKPWPEDQ